MQTRRMLGVLAAAMLAVFSIVFTLGAIAWGASTSGPTKVKPQGGTAVPATEIEVVPPLVVSTPPGGKVKLFIPPTATPTPTVTATPTATPTPTPTLTVGPTNCDVGADGNRTLVCLTVTVTPTPTLTPSPTATAHPTVLPTAACDATRVGQHAGDADEIDGRQAHSCTDLLTFTCVGGTNDGASCGNASSGTASICPSGWCARYAWRRPALRIAVATTSPGCRSEKIETDALHTVACPPGSNGTATMSLSGVMTTGAPIAPGQLPGNRQPLAMSAYPPSTNCTYYGPTPDVCVGYSTQKHCWGGTNHNATCSADSACPNGVCQDFWLVYGKPLRADGGVELGVPLKVTDLPTSARTGTAGWCAGDGTNDVTSVAMGIKLWNRAQDRIIEKICWHTNIVGGSIKIRRDGPATSGIGFPTPVPTIALPTPTAASTPGFVTADAGCLTGQSIEWAKDSHLSIQWTAATGVNNLCVNVYYSLKP